METVSVIIPTTGLGVRKGLLKRAIESVVSQEGVQAVPIVVLNGQEPDPEVAQDLRADSRIRLVRREEPGLPDAIWEGRKVVDSPWFSELDDDDLLLPGALSLRLEAMAGADAVITNGIRRSPTGDTLHIESMDRVARDPLLAMTRANWLLPGSWLCRTETVETSVFQELPPFLECTYLGLHFASRFRIRFLQEATVVWHTQSPASASASDGYILEGPRSLRRILAMDLPPNVSAAYRRRMGQALHAAADLHRVRRRRGEAWRHHLASLRWPGGIRFLPYTLRLLTSSLEG